MAILDKVASIANVLANGFIDIRPPAGEEWLIHNVYCDNGTMELRIQTSSNLTNTWYKPTFSNASSTNPQPTCVNGLGVHVTNSQWLRVANVTSWSIAINIGYSGIKTKG